MKIRTVKKVPRFIGEYFNEGILSKDDLSNISKLLVDLDYTIIEEEKLVAIVDEPSPLIDFYIEKSKLDCRYFCKYEDELGVPKSISSETFIIETMNGGELEVYIDFDYDCNCLTLIIEK